ncbi:hypothetical protein QYF36_009439 [Acer negundo]|nr:hypothetical protein QYF36_009439 [Acer negundo]
MSKNTLGFGIVLDLDFTSGSYSYVKAMRDFEETDIILDSGGLIFFYIEFLLNWEYLARLVLSRLMSAIDQKDIVRLLMTSVGSFIQDRLINKELRTQHKEQCAERLAAEDGSSSKDTEIRYSDQAVLANLD